ncbi:MAG: hypothetical protein A2Y12_09795 [Planctomycetes bacterium GWF2_42_9]|nr:MAG: hypothetical protein A2Y12_09795 [Planctomycetes bacterium GWF2_42_9]
MAKVRNRIPLKLLVVGGHPADAFDNAGGTCLHHTRLGDTVSALVLTNGARVHDVVISDGMRRKKQIPQGKKLEKLLEIRSKVKKEEVREACAIMGIRDVRFLTYDDSIFLVREKIIRDIACVIREIRPNIIITHYPYDNGGLADQHALTGQSVLHASWVANSVDSEYPNPPHRVAQIFFMGFPSHVVRDNALLREFSAHCQVYVDVSDVIHLKVEALGKMKSQQYNGRYTLKRSEAVEGSAGLGVGVPYAEPFIVAYSDIYQTLPVSEFLLKKSQEQEKDWFGRVGFLVSKDGNLGRYQRVLNTKHRRFKKE